MNGEHGPAEERLLDAALQQVLGARPVAEPRRQPRWFAAAAVLLSLSVVVALWVGSRPAAGLPAVPPAVPPAEPPAPQEPAQLPPPVLATGRAAVDALPVDTQNLVCEIDAPADLAALRRLVSLRHLVINANAVVVAAGAAGPSPPNRWREPPADLLSPLGELPALEDLKLPSALHFVPGHLRPLRAAPRLRSLSLVGEHVACTPGLVDELQALPQLRELRLRSVTVTADFVERLAALPLTRLQLFFCPGVDARVLDALASMRSLCALELVGLGNQVIVVRGAPAPLWPLEPASLAQLGKLPQLVELSLRCCELDDALLAALPKGLRKLDLSMANGVAAAGLASLRALGDLRELRVGGMLSDKDATDPVQRLELERIAKALREAMERRRAAMQDGAGVSAPLVGALAGLLPALRLQTLGYQGTLTKMLLDAIGALPELQRLELDVPRLSRAKTPQLRRVSQDDEQREPWPAAGEPFPTANAHFAALRRCPRLLRVVLVDFDAADAVAVKVTLGDRIAVETGNGVAIELPRGQDTGSEPAPMVWARNPKDLATLPATTESLTIYTTFPAELTELVRFVALRHLAMVGTSVLGPQHPFYRQTWGFAADTALEPLAALAHLERLELPIELPLRPAHLAPLRRLPRLRALLIDGAACTWELADALATLPQLRELSLRNGKVEAGFLPRLQPLGLERLVLQSCPNFGAERQAEIASWRSLRALEILSPTRVPGGSWLPVDKKAFAAICALPALRELSLWDDQEELVALLPMTLTRVELHCSPGPAAIASLRRIAALRDLQVEPKDEASADAFTEVVDALRLERFCTHGSLTPKLLHALANQPDLARLELRLQPGTDLRALVAAPGLRELTLYGYGALPLPTDYRPTLDDVKPLAGCASLRHLRLINCGLDSAAVQAAVGPRVQVEIEERL